ncbi:hypothetical protein CH370_20875 [Leptospira kmetyi]|nr:hypothetical protein CH370_20875 [Leptospira kmetyi]
MSDQRKRRSDGGNVNREGNFCADGFVFIREFRHWRSKQIIKASDYGHKFFRIPLGRRKK